MKSFAALIACAALAFGMFACSNASGGNQSPSPSPVQNGENQNTTPNAYNLIIDGRIANGTVIASTTSANPASKAVAGDTVTLIIKADSGYELDSISVVAANGFVPQLSVLGTNKRTFVMPKQIVTVKALFKTIALGNYSIVASDSIAGGSVTASPASAAPGEMVTLTATPDTGWRLDSWDVKDASGNSITVTGNAFSMPEGPVTINATFVKIDYAITVGSVTNGSVSANKTTANYGDTVTLTITANAGYELGELSVTFGGEPVSVDGGDVSKPFTMPAGDVSVSATFTEIPSASGAYTPLDAGTDGSAGTSGTYVTFGLWPQTIKAESVTVNEGETKTAFEFTYYKGSDGYWYAKLSDKYYKVEPIKWRVLTTSYNKIEGRKLLLAESVLIGKHFDDDSHNYQNSEIRKWLNSNASSGTKSDCVGAGGFLRTAFSIAERGKIAFSTVDNSVSSTLPYDYQFLNDDDRKNVWNDGANPNASDTSTTDKVFLLSEREVSTTSYGFKVSWSHGVGNSRIRQATDYAKASGADQSATAGYGCFWWLRSPYHTGSTAMKYVAKDGRAYEGYMWAYTSDFGIVPALCVENVGN